MFDHCQVKKRFKVQLILHRYLEKRAACYDGLKYTRQVTYRLTKFERLESDSGIDPERLF